MAAVTRSGLLRQLMTKKFREFTGMGMRYFCTDDAEGEAEGAAKLCMIIGENGAIACNADHFEDWDQYVQTAPILKLIPNTGLYGSLHDPTRPYHMNDASRPLLRSGSLSVRNANICGLSLINPFKKGNVVVHKQLGCMAFRSLQLDPAAQWKSNPSQGYNELCTFVKDSISDNHGISSPSKLPPQLESYLGDLGRPKVEENLMIDHPCTIPNIVYTDVCLEAFWFLVKEKPELPIKQSDIDDVLISIGSKQPRAFFDALHHGILHLFLPKGLQLRFPEKRYPFNTAQIRPLSDVQTGRLIVSICRHTPIHCKDPDVPPLVLSRLSVGSYSREDWTEVLRMIYPDFIRDVYSVLMAHQIWEKLGVRARLPIPSIYLAPATAFVSFRVLLIFMKE